MCTLYLPIYCMAGNFRGGGGQTIRMNYLLHESYQPCGKLVKTLLLRNNIVCKSSVCMFVCIFILAGI